MKKILITGANSYIGTSFENWLRKYEERYLVETLDVKDTKWREKSFFEYDVVLHVAALVHIKSKNKNMETLFYKINRDLAVEVALKAKTFGVNQFIFISSMSVYGDCVGSIINEKTAPKPNNYYGNSKLQAEEKIMLIQDENFNVVIIRPPMVYGKGSKGNFTRLTKLVRKIPIFPDYNNQRSMIYIENLCEFIRLMIENKENGVFHPQNKEYVKTSELVKLIAEANGKRIVFIKNFNLILKHLVKHSRIVNKVFGDLVYEQELSKYKICYQIKSLKDSIKS